MPNPGHVSVLTAPAVTFLAPQRGGFFLDCTLGGGGHSRALLEGGATRVLGLDRDAEALTMAAKTLEPWRDLVELVHADFRQLDAILDERGVTTVDGAIADIGLSSMQLDGEGRGFSFRRNEPLTCGWTGPAARRRLS